MLSANMIISGSIGSFGEKYLVSLKFIDVETGETVNTVSVYYDDMEDILKKSENLVEKLLEGLADTENSELASGANNTKPKAGYFSISAGYSEIFRETDNGPLASNLPNLENGGIYGSAENATDTATETFSNFYTHQLLEGVPITLGYEFPFLPGFSAGVWGSYLVGECYTDNYLLSGTLIDENLNIYYYNGGNPGILAALPEISRITVGVSCTFRFYDDAFGMKLDLGYNFSKIIIAKAGISFMGFFVKGSLGFPENIYFEGIHEIWTTSYDDGGIWSVEGGYEFKI